MSSILEALKKLEDEKAVRLSGKGNIAGKVVKAGRRPGQKPWWLLPVGMAAAATIAAGATYMLMGGFSSSNRPMQTEAPVASRQPPTVVLPPAAPLPLPDLPSVAVHNRVVPPSQHASVVRHAPVVNIPPQLQTSQRPFEPKNVEKPVVIPQSAALPAPPSLKVTGIGWQKDNADRLAVVNGRAASEGAVIDGARIEEIFPDRVRFSSEGRTFEIPLGKPSGESP